jgi:uncharacterized repeat protein (TIGR01451 family)
VTIVRASRRARLVLVAVATAAVGVVSCKDASTVDVLTIDAAGAVFGTAFLDNNGNGILDAQDPPLPKVPVVLTVAGGGQVVSQATTDSLGSFVLTDIPVGSYELGLDASVLGDSLQAVGSGADLVIRRDSTTRVNFGVSFPVLTLDEVRTAEPGRRVFTSGIALNPRQPFGDGAVHLQTDTLFLRAVNVARATINTGDSVRMLGRVSVEEGEPVLDDVTPFVLVSSATIPLPTETGTAKAASADGGRLDAALVKIRNAEISDTGTVAGAFHFRADDGSGKVDVELRSFLLIDPTPVRPDTIVRVKELTGLLVPLKDETGAVHWRIQPRGGGDVLLEVKQANLGIGVSVDKATAHKGDRLRFTVVLTNAGPLGASGVQVTDSIPVGMTFASASSTRGAYNAGTGIWDLDSLKVGATDTLKVDADVTTDLVGQTQNRASITRILREVDPNPANNSATVTVNIVAPAPVAPNRR